MSSMLATAIRGSSLSGVLLRRAPKLTRGAAPRFLFLIHSSLLLREEYRVFSLHMAMASEGIVSLGLSVFECWSEFRASLFCIPGGWIVFPVVGEENGLVVFPGVRVVVRRRAPRSAIPPGIGKGQVSGR
ncbi:hypothetical protein FHX37_0225 [Haloactinospora alba]|uniref:Uncharacterized protein n=1 Tax=Haloactinospora alba TaxID=405555 RepID=A0A543NEW5_9ACTN|nr:hypothetical protein [Haloactinospora alba]TQN30349.1 hypothetical protein FHX37_0225 [Haloactinospora alba]